MALFLIERNFAEQLSPSEDAIKAIGEANASAGVNWLYSFLSADKRKTFCLYEADDEDAIRTAATNAGLPADVVIELAGEIQPEELLGK